MEIPPGDATPEHRAVIGSGIQDQAGVLLFEKKFVGGFAWVASRVFRGVALPFHQLIHQLVFTRCGESETAGIRIRRKVVAEALDAGAAVAGAPARIGIAIVEIPDNGFERSMETVEIEPVESGFCLTARQRIVMRAHPGGEVDHLVVAPHPGLEAPETGQRLDIRLRVALAAHIRGETVGEQRLAGDRAGVQPVGFYGDRVEILFHNQAPGNLGALHVEFLGAVGPFSDEHETGVANALEQRIVVTRPCCKRPSRFPDRPRHDVYCCSTRHGILLTSHAHEATRPHRKTGKAQVGD